MDRYFFTGFNASAALLLFIISIALLLRSKKRREVYKIQDIILFLFSILLFFILFIKNKLSDPNQFSSYMDYGIMLSSFMIATGYIPYRLRSLTENGMEHEWKDTPVFPLFRKSRSYNSEKSEELLLHQLTEILKQQFFLDPNINLEITADRIGTSVHELSELINRKYGVRFQEFINKHRIYHALELLQGSKKIKSRELAALCGFGAYNTFFLSFKRYVGCSPEQYREKMAK